MRVTAGTFLHRMVSSTCARAVMPHDLHDLCTYLAQWIVHISEQACRAAHDCCKGVHLLLEAPDVLSLLNHFQMSVRTI